MPTPCLPPGVEEIASPALDVRGSKGMPEGARGPSLR